MKREYSFREIGKRTRTHPNKEGFPSYFRSSEEQVIQVLMTGSTANTFYVNANKLVPEMLNVIKEYKNTEFLAKATLYAREQGFMRTIPIAGLVEISRRNSELFYDIANRVCRNPKDWRVFVDIARSGMLRRGVGRSIKRKIHEVLADMSIYHAIKYPSDVRDLINISRPKEEINPKVINYIKRGEYGEDEVLKALKTVRTSENEDDIVNAIKTGRLPYEAVVGGVNKMTPRIWEALLYQAPYFNLLRNLNTFIRHGVLEKKENREYVIQKLTNDEAIRKSMVMPFRFYVAYRILDWDFRYRDELANALEEALEKSVSNVPKVEGRLAIMTDVSGSMSSNVLGDYSVLQCVDIAGLFTSIMIKNSDKMPVVLPFNHAVKHTMIEELMSKERVMDMASVFYPSGGTSLSSPINYMIENNIEVDKIIGFTDNEEWVGSPFMTALQEYRRRINPDVKVYLNTLMPYRDSPVPQTEKNVFFIYGFSDAVLRYYNYDVEKQIKEVEKVKL